MKYFESVEVAGGGFVVNGDDDGLNEKIKFGGALDTIGIRAWRVVTSSQDGQGRVGAHRIGEIVEKGLECRRRRSQRRILASAQSCREGKELKNGMEII